MGHLLVVSRPSLVPGFHLAGVEASAAADSEAAQSLIAAWLDAGESGLLVVDDGLYAGFDPTFQRRLSAADQLPHITIPGGEPLEPGMSRRGRITELIRKAIGFHVTFGREEA